MTKLALLIAVAVLFASPAASQQPADAPQFAAPEDLEPELSVMAGGYRMFFHDTALRLQFESLFDMELRMVAASGEEGGEPDFGIGFDGGRITAIQLSAPLGPTLSIQAMRNAAQEPGAAASFSPGSEQDIAESVKGFERMLRHIQAQTANLAPAHCSVSLDPPLSGRLASAWRRMILRTRYGPDGRDRSRSADATYHFSMATRIGSGGAVAAGVARDGGFETRPALFIRVARDMREYACTHESKALQLLEGDLAALEAHLAEAGP